MPKKLTYEYVKRDFNNGGCELLSKEYINCETPLEYECECGNISKITFSNFLQGHRCKICANKRLSISNRKHPLNENYFSKIDTKNKAYILGYILADGSVNTKQNRLIFVTSKDLDILKFITKELETSNRIKEETEYCKKTNKIYNKHRLCICSYKIVKDLINLNIVERKTYCKIIPNETHVPEHLRSAFLLGFSDGDGSVGIYFKKSTKIEWRVGAYHKENLQSIKDLCNLDLGRIYTLSYKHFSSWEINKQKDLQYLYHYFYDDPPDFFLQRKKEKFDSIINYIIHNVHNASS